MSRPRAGRPVRRTATAADAPAAARRPPTAEALGHVSFAITRAYYTYLGFLESVLEETGLGKHVHPGMGHVLFALFAQDNLAVKDLVERVGLSYATVSGMVSRMKRAKLVDCRRDAGDGRLVRVQLTPLGKSLEPPCRAVVARIDGVMHAGTSEKDFCAAQRALRQMTTAMRAYGDCRRNNGVEPVGSLAIHCQRRSPDSKDAVSESYCLTLKSP
jgi:DNA-binding MarR family transcriptional regulator